jgi:hypothetical protein
MIQLVLSTVAATAMQTPRVMKNAMVVLRLVMRIGMGRRQDSTGGELSAVSYRPCGTAEQVAEKLGKADPSPTKVGSG